MTVMWPRGGLERLQAFNRGRLLLMYLCNFIIFELGAHEKRNGAIAATRADPKRSDPAP